MTERTETVRTRNVVQGAAAAQHHGHGRAEGGTSCAATRQARPDLSSDKEMLGDRAASTAVEKMANGGSSAAALAAEAKPLRHRSERAA